MSIHDLECLLLNSLSNKGETAAGHRGSSCSFDLASIVLVLIIIHVACSVFLRLLSLGRALVVG
jgi:hypothetical protein